MIQMGYECWGMQNFIGLYEGNLQQLRFLHLKEVTKPSIYCESREQRKQIYRHSGLSRQRTTTLCIVALVIYQKKCYEKL